MSDGNYSMTIPAHRGWYLGFTFLWLALRCLVTGTQTITIDVGVNFNEGRPL